MADLELTVKQAADKLGVDQRTVRRWLASGKLTGRRIVRGNLTPAWRVDAAAIQRTLADKSNGQFSGHSSTDKISGRPQRTMTAGQVAILADQVQSLREEGAEYRQVIELQAQAISGLAAQVRGLTEEVQQLQRLLPPAPEEVTARQGWWGRLWRRRG